MQLVIQIAIGVCLGLFLYNKGKKIKEAINDFLHGEEHILES